MIVQQGEETTLEERDEDGERLRPKYRVIQDAIRQGIDDGSLLLGEDRLPAEQELATRFGVAYMTIRAAVDDLVREGLLERRRGKGTFVLKAVPTQAVTPRLALVLPALETHVSVSALYYMPPIVQGFCARAVALGHEPEIIGRSHESLLADPPMGDPYRGIACLLIREEDEDLLEALADRDVPLVGINRYSGRRSLMNVFACQARGTAEAVAHLIELGHRRIVFLNGPEGNLGSNDRARGYRKAMRAAGLTPCIADAQSGESSDYSEEAGAQRARRLLSQSRPPTAFVAANDVIAVGAMHTAVAMGISVPEQLSLVGCGNLLITRYTQPPLSTVHLPLEEIGAAAADLLVERYSGNRPRVLKMPAPFIDRGTVAAAPQA